MGAVATVPLSMFSSGPSIALPRPNPSNTIMWKNKLLLMPIHLIHLPQDHVPLPQYWSGIKPRVQQDVHEYVHGAAHVPPKNLHKVHSLLPQGVSVQVSTHAFDLYFELVLHTTTCALEGHVLEEVRHAVVVQCLVPQPGVDPYADCCCLGPWDGLRRNVF